MAKRDRPAKMDDRKRRSVPQQQVRASFTGRALAEKWGYKHVERPPAPKPPNLEQSPKLEIPERRYTLDDLAAAEREYREGDSGRHMNPGRTRRHSLYWRERIAQIRAALIRQGIPVP